MKRRPKGSGFLWRPKNRGVETAIWWMGYSPKRGAKPVRESTHTTVRTEAERILRARVAAVDRGEVDPGRITLTDLQRNVEADYENNGRRSSRNVTGAFARLADQFGADTPARNMDAGAVEKYKVARRKAGAKNGTINRELAQLRRGLRLAVNLGLLTVRPTFSLLREGRPRAGFLEMDQFDSACRQMAPDLRPLVTFLYWTGWRSGEALALQWRMVDRKAGVIRIEESKNDEARTIPYRALPVLDDLIESQRRYTDAVEKRGQIVPWVFHRGGRRIKVFLGAWKGACKRAGVPGRLVHDMRRSAARNMIRAGIAQKAAMLIGGWKTPSVFERYNIVDEKILAESLSKLDALRGKP